MESQITESQIIDSQNHFSQILDIQSHRLIKSKIQKVTKSKVYIVANSKNHVFTKSWILEKDIFLYKIQYVKGDNEKTLKC